MHSRLPVAQCQYLGNQKGGKACFGVTIVFKLEFMSSIAVPIPAVIVTIVQPRAYGYCTRPLLLTDIRDLFVPTTAAVLLHLDH